MDDSLRGLAASTKKVIILKTCDSRASIQNRSEDELLTAAQARDEAAFAELMRRNESSSMKLALSILRDRQDAEDEVQNSYMNAWRYVPSFRGGAKFSTWMSRIVTNQCLMKLRKGKRASFLYLDEGPGGEVATIELPDLCPTPEAQLGGKGSIAALHGEIRKLPPLLRNVLVLRDLNELPIDEVARHLGITIVAAKSRLQRARMELKRRLEGGVSGGAAMLVA